jgi:hypothetical protein
MAQINLFSAYLKLKWWLLQSIRHELIGASQRNLLHGQDDLVLLFGANLLGIRANAA